MGPPRHERQRDTRSCRTTQSGAPTRDTAPTSHTQSRLDPMPLVPDVYALDANIAPYGQADPETEERADAGMPIVPSP